MSTTNIVAYGTGSTLATFNPICDDEFDVVDIASWTTGVSATPAVYTINKLMTPTHVKDSNGNPLGGIKAKVINSDNQQIEVERGEVIITRDAVSNPKKYKIEKLIPYNYKISKRIRTNKFKEYVYENKEYISIRICDINFRRFLNDCGIPSGKKSKIIEYLN
jgi:hypothetical protein